MIRLPAVLVTLVVLSFPAEATITIYTAVLNGASESPANGSLGTGFTTVTADDVAHTLKVEVSFSGLSGTTTASHIHCCTTVPGVSTAGVATETPTFALFPLGVTSGAFTETFDTTLMASFNAPFVTANGGSAAGAEAALFTGLADGKAYLNIHSSQFGGGEIRGFLAPVPEPDTYALLILGVGALALGAWRRRGRVSRHEA